MILSSGQRGAPRSTKVTFGGNSDEALLIEEGKRNVG